MAKAQKTYTQELKREAVRLAQTSGKPIAQAARELGISDTSIYQWRKALPPMVAAPFREAVIRVNSLARTPWSSSTRRNWMRRTGRFKREALE